MARQNHYLGEKVTKQEFLEHQKETRHDFSDMRRGVTEEINIAYERFYETVERLERYVEKSEIRQAHALDKVVARSERMLNESKSSRNWIIGTCIAVITVVVGVASAFIGFFVSVIASGGLPF